MKFSVFQDGWYPGASQLRTTFEPYPEFDTYEEAVKDAEARCIQFGRGYIIFQKIATIKPKTITETELHVTEDLKE